MTSISKYLVNHLVTFSLQDGEVKNVEEAQARLSLLARSDRLWSQEMVLEVGPDHLRLKDVQSQEELEKYSVSSILRCDAIVTEKRFPSLLLLVCQSVKQKKPDILFFNCEAVKAEQVRGGISRAVSGSSSRTNKHQESSSLALVPTEEMMDPYGIPNSPLPHAPNPPPANPPPYPGPRAANGVNGGQPDLAFLRAEREVGILNHCFDDIEVFMSKLQQSAEAATILSQRKKKKKKSKKQNAEEDLLVTKARPPEEAEFVDIFQKFKYCFSLLARLKFAISNPSSEELLHHVFKPLDIMVKTTGGPSLAASVSSPAMTSSAVTLLQSHLNEEEKELWTSLGSNWTLSRSQLRGPVPPYTPVFLDGWKPEANRADGQLWEDPLESQHKQEAMKEKEKQQPPQQAAPATHPVEEIDSSILPPEGERLYSCSYDFVARNNSELSVLQGETLEVVESSKRWWKCRNRFNEIGFVPFNILEPVSHAESPGPQRSPMAPPLTASSGAPPSSPGFTHQSNPRPRSLIAYSHNAPTSEDTDKAMLVNDELLQRLTNGKSGLNKALVIPRSSDTSVPLDYHSPPEEVADWLKGKGFSEPTVQCLGVLTGAQLFSLNKEELRAVIPEEGTRVYSQLTVQKALLEDARRATELEAVMEKQKMKVDLKLESSTL